VQFSKPLGISHLVGSRQNGQHLYMVTFNTAESFHLGYKIVQLVNEMFGIKCCIFDHIFFNIYKNLLQRLAVVIFNFNGLIAKKTFNRPRPYVANPLIKPCISLENSAAYPSGHTMIARVYARILSAVYPERAEKFLALADQYSEYRVIGGVHHPSDVKSGKILADHLATKMIDTEDFVHELASR